jgi:probable HAF family extracellular repeat protein
VGFALNACGDVTGAIYYEGLDPHVFLFSKGITTDLGADNGPCASNAGAIGYGINASDTIVGVNCANSYQSPMLYFTGASSIIPLSASLVASYAIGGEGRAINSSGQMAGYVQVTSGNCSPDVYQPFVYDTNSGVAQDLSTSITASISSTACSAQALAINDAGQIAGYFSDSGAPHAFVYNPTNGKAIDLGNLGYQFTYAYGINATGDATGWSSNSSGLAPDAFLYTSGTPPAGLHCYASTPINPDGKAYICDLGNLGLKGVYQGSGGSQGNAINASDQVTGYSWALVNSVYVQHAFLYSNGVMKDLNTLVSQCTNPSGSLVGCTLVNGVAINDAGQILVQGYLNSNPSQTVTFLVTPPPAALTAQLSSASVDGTGNYIENILITNTGSAPANVPALTSASLVVVESGKPATIPTSTALPAVQNSLVPGASTTLSLVFPPSAGSAGAAAALRWSITYAAGSASGTLRIVLP